MNRKVYLKLVDTRENSQESKGIRQWTKLPLLVEKF